MSIRTRILLGLWPVLLVLPTVIAVFQYWIERRELRFAQHEEVTTVARALGEMARADAATLGSFLVFVMSFVTLSFLITTPECWVPNLGDTTHGFPYLSGAGRLVIKDAIMMGAALVTMADSARAVLRREVVSAAV